MNKFKKFWKKLGEYNKIAKISEIARRYFVMNSFDGILTILGILIGTYIAKVQDYRIIISTGLAVSIAMAVSGISGTYLTEEAERTKKLKDLGRQTLTNMKYTSIGKAERAATLIVSFIDGLAPFLSAMIILTPFFLINLINLQFAYYISISISFLLLIILGGFLGHISREGVFKNAMKMVLAGLVSVTLIFILGVHG